MKTFQIYEPQTCANPTDRYLAEIRSNGWLIDRFRAETREDAERWANEHKGEDISPKLIPSYVTMITKYQNK